MKTSQLKAVLVTSEITYVPRNYQGLIESFIQNSSIDLKGVIFLKNLDKKTLKSILGLGYLGALKTQFQLIKNILELPLKKREKFLRKHSVESYYFQSMNDPAAIKKCQDLDIDLIINARTRCIYRKAILETPNIGCINIHHGMLPDYRGTMCDLYALSENREAGFTIHVMNKKIDDGKIMVKKVVSDGSDLDYLQYLNRASKIEGETLANLTSTINDQGEFPEGQENRSENIVFTKNPTKKQITQFKKKGMIL